MAISLSSIARFLEPTRPLPERTHEEHIEEMPTLMRGAGREKKPVSLCQRHCRDVETMRGEVSSI